MFRTKSNFTTTSAKDSNRQQKPGRVNLLPMFVLGATILGALCIVLNVTTLIAVSAVARQPPPTLVELADGQSISVIPLGSKERTPEAIKAFVGETIVKLFDWRGTIDSQDPNDLAPQKDPGIEVGDNQKVTTSTWQAGFALKEDIRPDMLLKIAQLTPDTLFTTNSNIQGVLITRNIGQPERIEEGKWKVSLVANLIIFEGGDNIGKAIAFNKSVFVSAVDTPKLPVNYTDLQKTIWKSRRAGLEIFAMQDLT